MRTEMFHVDGQTDRTKLIVAFSQFLRTFIKIMCAITTGWRMKATTFCYANWIRIPAHPDQFHNFRVLNSLNSR
jgi:hypothetical protein